MPQIYVGRGTLAFLVLLFFSQAAMAEKANKGFIFSVHRTLSDADFKKSLLTKKLEFGKWYGFDFHLDNRIEIIAENEVNRTYKAKYLAGHLMFLGQQDKLTQINIKAVENTKCLDQDKFERLKEFVHIKVQAPEFRNASIVALLNSKFKCKS